MTKYQLAKLLEPFDDEVEILIQSDEGVMFEPSVFYGINSDRSGQILFGRKPIDSKYGKFVELKV